MKSLLGSGLLIASLMAWTGCAPASVAAVDLRGARGLSLDQQADFYRALGRAAEARGLRWGGSWRRRDPTWARCDLGWDPGHVEHRGLCLALRAT